LNHTTYEKKSDISRIILRRILQIVSMYEKHISPGFFARNMKDTVTVSKKVPCYWKLREYNSRSWQFYMRVLNAIIYSSYKIYVHFMLTHKITLILRRSFRVSKII